MRTSMSGLFAGLPLSLSSGLVRVASRASVAIFSRLASAGVAGAIGLEDEPGVGAGDGTSALGKGGNLESAGVAVFFGATAFRTGTSSARAGKVESRQPTIRA